MSLLAGVLSPSQSILLADAGELIRLLIFFVVIGVSLLGKLLSSAPRKQPAPPRRRPPPPPDPQRGRPVGGGRPQARAAGQGRLPTNLEIERELEEFLRRGSRPQPSRPTPEVPRPGPLRPEPEPAVVAEVVTPLREQPVTVADSPLGRSVASHVQDHLRSSGRVASHASQLGAELAHADEKVEGRLRQIFEHDLGSLEKTPSSQEREIAEGTDAAVWDPREGVSAEQLRGDIEQMLRSPEDVRKVIVLTEILKRPATF